MNDPDPRYYRVRKGRAYWEPGRFGTLYNMPKSQPLGPDGADAKALALKWNERLDAERRQKAREVVMPASVGMLWVQFRKTESWRLMTPATRAMYERAWPHISDRFRDKPLLSLSAADSESFHVELHPAHPNSRDPQGKKKLSWFMAHLVLKHWRLLITAGVEYGVLKPPAPIGRVSNPAPPSRTQVWTDEEIRVLIETAEADQEWGMALAIQIGWETMMSTVDVRLLTLNGWKRPKHGEDEGTIETVRRKSKKIVRITSTPELDRAITAYLARVAAAGIKLDPDEPMLRRNANFIPFRDRHSFKDVFAHVRGKAFPGDLRQFGDMRRSGATEARLGGADDKDLGATMANRLAQDETLQSTYIVTSSKKVQDARRAGRAQHRAKFRKSEN